MLDAQTTVDAERTWGGILWTQDTTTPSAREHVSNAWIASAGYQSELLSERWWRTYADSSENLFVRPPDFPRQSIPGTLARVDLQAVEVADVYAYPDGEFPHPPTFIPRVGASRDGEGYILAHVHADEGKRLDLFDAERVADGPIASARAAGFNPPLLLHSWWMAERCGPRPSAYAVDPEADAWQTLADFGADPTASIGIAKVFAGQR